MRRASEADVRKLALLQPGVLRLRLHHATGTRRQGDIDPSGPSAFLLFPTVVSGAGLSGHNSTAAGMSSSSFSPSEVFISRSASRSLAACSLQNHT